ncbi:MAG TPA: sugar ABC transporter substrate-binding protein [Chloroflexota bacterium]|nr:sugar ABC transporter substrate-binding protein [Chloroflexota bacterium]
MVTRRHLLLSAPAALLSACGTPTTTSQPGASAAATAAKSPATVTWLAWSGAGSETEQYDLNRSEYTRLNPQHTVDYINVGNLDAISEKLITLVTGGTPPDVVQTQYSFCVDLAARDLVAPLDTYMARDRVRREDYVPGEIDEFAWKKKQYGIPKDNALRVLFFNQDLFDKAGVKHPTDSWTWDDLVENGRKLTSRGGADGPTFGIASFQLNINDSPSYSITRSFGGEWYNADWTASTLDSGPTLDSIQFVADWHTKHRIVNLPGEISGNVFRSGRAAMLIAFAQEVFFLKEEKVSFKYDVVPLPRGKAGAFPVATGSGQSLVKTSKYPEAGWQFIKYVTGPEAQRRITSLKRWGSSRVDTLEAILPTDGTPKNFRAAFIDPLQGKTKDKPVAIPTPPRAKDLEAIYRTEFAKVWTGERTARDAATAAKPQLDAIMRTAGGR